MNILITGIILVLLSSCASSPPEPVVNAPSKHSAEQTQAPTEQERILKPFAEDTFRDLLIAEFAARRQQFDLALGNYLKQAHISQDKGVAKRATYLARYIGADKAALDTSQLWISLDPENSEAHFIGAIQLAKSGRVQQAFNHMQTVLRNGDKTNFAYISATATALPEVAKQQMLNDIDALLVDYADVDQLKLGKAILLQSLGRAELALETIRSLPGDSSNTVQTIIIENKLLQQLGREAEALTHIQTGLLNHPDNEQIRLHYARLLTKTDITAAKMQFEELLKKKPKDTNLLFSLALINKEQKQLDQAKLYFERLIKLKARVNESHYYLGNIAELEKDWTAAERHYKKIPHSREMIPALRRLIEVYKKQGLIDTARKTLKKQRIETPKEAVRIYLLEADLLLDNDQIYEGYDLLSDALNEYPNNVDLLYSRSIFSEQQDKLINAEQDLQAILQQQPENAAALNALGYMLANHSTRYQEAYTLVNKALLIKPDDPAIMDSLGWIEYRKGNLTSAQKLLEKAHKIFPDAEIAAHLGEVLWKRGLNDRAWQVWKEAHLLNPSNETLLETVQRLSGRSLEPKN